MALTEQEYYERAVGTFGDYQFVPLEEIINQFMVTHTGEHKIINKASRIDVAFHAQRALAELSFDTFKSVKSYQIDVSNTLVMTLPHDYVNYTRLTWVDSSGIKHPLYTTNSTSNPFQIAQEDDGSYIFPDELELIANGDFEDELLVNDKPAPPWYRNGIPNQNNSDGTITNFAGIAVKDGALKFAHRTRSSHGSANWGYAMSCWQKIDVTGLNYIDISAAGTAVDMTNGPGVLRFGISTSPGDTNGKNIVDSPQGYAQSTNALTSSFDLQTDQGVDSYLEWESADGTGVEKELLQINVSAYNEVYVLITSFHEFTTASETLTRTNFIDNLSATNSEGKNKLSTEVGNELNSSTWKNYKSTTPSENNNDDYEDDTYWLANGERYGLDPQHAQANGSFFIDPRLGRIHFSSNIAGKTIILDYISDSLGTEEEMQVHKFAEDAMYKWITHAVISTSSYGQALVPRLTKDKFAAVRKAKLRLSNIKLEELTQVLRGKSKQIKH